MNNVKERNLTTKVETPHVSILWDNPVDDLNEAIQDVFIVFEEIMSKRTIVNDKRFETEKKNVFTAFANINDIITYNMLSQSIYTYLSKKNKDIDFSLQDFRNKEIDYYLSKNDLTKSEKQESEKAMNKAVFLRATLKNTVIQTQRLYNNLSSFHEKGINISFKNFNKKYQTIMDSIDIARKEAIPLDVSIEVVQKSIDKIKILETEIVKHAIKSCDFYVKYLQARYTKEFDWTKIKFDVIEINKIHLARNWWAQLKSSDIKDKTILKFWQLESTIALDRRDIWNFLQSKSETSDDLLFLLKSIIKQIKVNHSKLKQESEAKKKKE